MGITSSCEPASGRRATELGINPGGDAAIIDPPYLPATRSQKSRKGKIAYHAYTQEMTVGDHAKLLPALCELEGMVVLSGYASDLYDRALAGWRRIECAARGDGAVARTEVLWLNPRAARAKTQQELF